MDPNYCSCLDDPRALCLQFNCNGCCQVGKCYKQVCPCCKMMLCPNCFIGVRRKYYLCSPNLRRNREDELRLCDFCREELTDEYQQNCVKVEQLKERPGSSQRAAIVIDSQ